MKRYRLPFILLFLILFISVIGLFSINGLGSTEDIHYIPTNDNFYSNSEIVYHEQNNIRNQTEFTQIYNGTYSFTNEVVGTQNETIDYIDYREGTPLIEIIGENDGHSKVLRTTSLGLGWEGFYNEFIPQTSGTVEYWIRPHQNDNKIYVALKDASPWSVTPRAQYQFETDGYISVELIDKFTYSANIWYHVRIEFDVNTDWHFWWNGKSVDGGAGFSWNEAIASVSRTWFLPLEPGAKFDIDGIGYSWDSFYDIGDNTVPIINTLNISQVDKWEFALQERDVLNPVGLDDPNGWDDYEESGDNVNIATETTNDRTIYMFSASYENGIEKDDFIVTDSEILNITWKYYYNILDLLAGNTEMKVYSNDSTLIAYINIDHGEFAEDGIHTLQYWDGVSFVDLSENSFWLSSFQNYEFNLYINYIDDIAVLTYKNTTDYKRYIIPLIVSGKVGLGRVRFRNTKSVGEAINLPITLDSIGVYAEGVSLSDEYAWRSIVIPNNWNIQDNNLIYLDCPDSPLHFANFSTSEGVYQVGVSDFNDILDLFYTYYSYPKRFNIYDKFISTILNPYLIVYQLNWVWVITFWIDIRGFDINQLSIDGVKLVQDANEFPLIYTYSVDNTEPLENFFYVSNSRIYYSLETSNSRLEYIQARFNIDDISTTNRSIRFSATISGYPFLYGEGGVYANFKDLTSYVFVFDESITFNQILTQKKVIETFTLLITDNDNDLSSGSTLTGYLSTITLVYYPNIGITIITTDLLLMIIPLMILILPSVVIGKRFGKKYVIYMLMLMSLVCVITGLIPYWMFFVMMFSFATFLFYSFKKGEMG